MRSSTLGQRSSSSQSNALAKMDLAFLCERLVHQQEKSQRELRAADLLFSSSKTGLCSDPEGVRFKPCYQRKVCKSMVK